MIRVLLKNVGILQEADIMLNGLTVISGLNNTGKSTVGKTLFSVFHGIQSYKLDFPKAAVRYLAADFLELLIATGKSQKTRNGTIVQDGTSFHGIVYPYQTALDYGIKGIEEYVNRDFTYVSDERKQFVNERIATLKDRLQQIKSPDFEFDVLSNTVMETFRKELGRTPKNVFSNANGTVKIFTDNIHDILLSLTDNNLILHENCFRQLKINPVFSEVNYIETPFLIDDMDRFHNIIDDHAPVITNHKETMLYKMVVPKSGEDVIEAAFRKKRMEILSEEIVKVLPGSIEYKKRFVYHYGGHEFDLSTLATGMKSYAILQLLLQNGYLPEKSLLIIDEPEIHLHPAWQLLYAEMLVLMVKKLNIYLVIATHSPYFLQAINIFQERHELGDKVHFYLAESYGTSAVISNIDGNLEKSYNLMAEPILTLKKYRDEMQEQDNDHR